MNFTDHSILLQMCLVLLFESFLQVLSVILLGLAVAVVLGQNSEEDFANPPPIPVKGMMLATFTSLCDLPCVPTLRSYVSVPL